MNAVFRWIDTHERGFLVDLFTVALIGRLLFSFAVYPAMKGPLSLGEDPDLFGRLASNWVDGDGYTYYEGSPPTTYRGPGLPVVLAGMYLLTGDMQTGAVLVQCVVTALVSVVVYLIGKQAFGRRIGTVAAVITAVHPMMFWYCPRIRYETLLTLYVALGVYAVLRLRVTRRWREALLAGLWFGMAALVSQTALLLPLLLFGLVIGWERQHRRALILRAAAGTLVTTLVIAPWTIRNYHETGGKFIPVHSGGVMEFVSGIYYVDYYDQAPLRVVILDHLAQAEVARLAGHEPGRFDRGARGVDEALWPYARDYVLHSPEKLLARTIVQIPRFWYLSESPAKSLFLAGVEGILLLPLLVGAIWWRRDRDWLIVLAPVVYFNLVYAVFHAQARFSTPVIPNVALLGMVGADTALGRMRLRYAARPLTRVLMLVENTPYVRDRRVQHEAETLCRAGYQVSVIGPCPPGGTWHQVINGVHCYQFPEPRSGAGLLGYGWEYGYSMAAAFALSLYVAGARGFDVIHAANPPDTFCLIAAFYKLFGKRFVFDHHDLAPEMYDVRFPSGGNPWVRRVLLRLEHLSCRLADHVITCNESYRALEMARGGVADHRITIVRNGPDELPIDAADRSGSKNGTVIAYVGLIGFQDGADYLISALYHLAHDLGRTDFKGLILGDGPALPDLKKQAHQQGIQSLVDFKGWVPHEQVAGYLKTADICAAPEPSNPYTDRSTTIKIMEYMAAARPVVAFDLPEHRFTAGDAALYAPPNDTLAFARQLAHLMDHPPERQRLGQLGRARVEAHLAWRHQAPHLLKAYAALAQKDTDDALT